MHKPAILPIDAVGDAGGRLLAQRYRLLSPIGRGGAGVVWAAQDELLQRAVAVKEVLAPLAASKEDNDLVKTRVLREARALARLHSPSIVAVYDVVEEDARHWIVMELVEAVSLADVVRTDGPLSVGRVAEIGLALAEALAAAHAAGVLHRDVKPGNVLLGTDGRVRLTDFGIAWTEGDVTLTGTGALVGSPAYIAPERVRGGPGSTSSDLWALGGTLYTAIEGSPPYDGPETFAVLTAVAEGRRRPFVLAGPLEPLLADLLDLPEDQRPSMDEVRAQLAAAARDAGVGGSGFGSPRPRRERRAAAPQAGDPALASAYNAAPPTTGNEIGERDAAGYDDTGGRGYDDTGGEYGHDPSEAATYLGPGAVQAARHGTDGGAPGLDDGYDEYGTDDGRYDTGGERYGETGDPLDLFGDPDPYGTGGGAHAGTPGGGPGDDPGRPAGSGRSLRRTVVAGVGAITAGIAVAFGVVQATGQSSSKTMIPFPSESAARGAPSAAPSAQPTAGPTVPGLTPSITPGRIGSTPKHTPLATATRVTPTTTPSPKATATRPPPPTTTKTPPPMTTPPVITTSATASSTTTTTMSSGPPPPPG